MASNLILTVTLNPALDKTYQVSRFAPGGVYHTEQQHTGAGGKGINVARVAKTLGAEVITTGFFGGQTGDYARHLLAQEGLNPDFEPCQQETRLCTAIVDPVSHTETKVNEPGPKIAPEEAARFLDRLRKLARQANFVTLSGRMPPGLPPDFYADCIEAVRESGAWVGLDTHGERIAATLQRGVFPDLLKPNAEELSEYAGHPILTFSDALPFTRAWRQAGCDSLITFGAQGALLHIAAGIWIGAPPVVQYKSAVGSGDAAFGAYVWALSQKMPFQEALQWAMGAGAANAETFGAALCDQSHIESLAQEVQMQAFQEA